MKRMKRKGLSAGVVALTLAMVVPVGGLLARAEDEDPEYPHGEFEDDCSLCHQDDAWAPAVISRDFEHTGRFERRGAHQGLRCLACHPNVRFDLARRECVACHADVHRGEMGSDCSRCHTDRNFIDRTAMVRSHQATRFPLRGAHRALDCEDCHTLVPEGRLQYVNRSAECEGCHLDDFRQTASPDHSAFGFPTVCEECHTPITWDLPPGTFDHAGFAGTPCATCHAADYDGASDPDHRGINLPTDCELCHSGTAGWTIVGGFDHGVVAGTPCASCHLEDYRSTTDPGHQAAGFPVECDSCHFSSATWLGAEFDHDGRYFPIYSGKHRGRWDTCADCHVDPGNFATFRCTDCHEHSDEAEVTADHDEVQDFVYESRACLECHPQGSH